MPAAKWGNWFPINAQGDIPEQHLPCAMFQYYWGIDTIFDIPGGWGFSGGRMSIDFEISIGDRYHSNDHASFICMTLFGMYEYIPGVMTMTGFPTYPHFSEAGPFFVTDTPDDTGGMGEGYIQGSLYSPMFKVPLPAGTTVDVQEWTPQVPMQGGYQLWMRVVGGAKRPKRMVKDPVSGDEYLPRIEMEMLVLRTRLHDGFAGPRVGLVLTYANGVATVTAGSGVIGHQDVTAAEALTADVATTGTHYLHLVPDDAGGVTLESSDGPYDGPAWCLGRVKNNVLAKCSGVLIADDVDEVAIGRGEDGKLIVRYDSGNSQDLSKVSTDRGVTWE
jgi:hypothetical protein